MDAKLWANGCETPRGFVDTVDCSANVDSGFPSQCPVGRGALRNERYQARAAAAGAGAERFYAFRLVRVRRVYF